ncbi:MAG: hypothetical protein WDO24_02185 [Pseudomonadota bacterium]
MHDLDLVAVGILEAHAPAAARLVERLDRRRPLEPRQLVEILGAGGVERQADMSRRAELGDMDVMRRIGAAHEQRSLGAIGADHAEVGQEFLGLVQIGGTGSGPRRCRSL